MTALEKFALAVLEQSSEDVGDILLCDVDGLWLQDKAEELGILHLVHVTGGEECWRFSNEVQKAMEQNNG